MSKWKKMKADVRMNFRKVRHVYELDYTHVFVKVTDSVVYDVNDGEYYKPQTGVLC